MSDNPALSNDDHEIQRRMLERLGIWWMPGKTFYSLLEDELTSQWARAEEMQHIATLKAKEVERLEAEIERLRVALKSIAESKTVDTLAPEVTAYCQRVLDSAKAG